MSQLKEKRPLDSQPERIERTGQTTFNVHHDDGSIFECRETRPGIAAKLDHAPRPSSGNIFSGIGSGDKDMSGWERVVEKGATKYRKVYGK